MEKRYTLSVHDMSRNKLCELYDSKIQMTGEPYDIEHVDPIDGLKSITFTLPRTVNGEENWRAAYMTNDYLLRWGVDGVYDWFVIDEPQDSHTGMNDVILVTANHVASLLNRKNLYGSFDDTNGIDTCKNLITKALTGTGWTLGLCDTFYEADGTTEKIRSYKCNEKTGAFSMIAGICELFVAYPTFNGDTKKVDIHALANHDGMMEVVFGKNLDSIARTRTSADLITRLYVEGDYSQSSYVGIDSVNPTGLPFIMNFDYYREIGQFKQSHETALNQYLNTMAASKRAIEQASASEQTATTQLATIWGAGDFILYSVTSGVAAYVMKSAGATDEDAQLAAGDVCAAVQSNGTYTYYTLPSNRRFATNIRWAVKFLGPVGGTMGAKEVAAETKTTTVSTLNEAIAAAQTQTEKASLTDERNAQQASITAMNTERYAEMSRGITLARSIGGYMATIQTQQARQETAELTLQNALGDMLKDGAWNDKNYVAGQEESLYVDALAVLGEMSRPQYDYSLSILDLSTLTGHEGEDFKKNQKIRIYDEATGVNDIAYVSEKRTHPRRENTNTITLSTDETGVALKRFDTLVSHIMAQADIIKARQEVYERAKAFSGDGTLAAEVLDGEINLLKNKLGSTASGIYTDPLGNLVIEAADGSSAMMLTGAGFMVASDRTASGEWKWRTFGTGDGFTADMVTTGILRAGAITILGSDQFYWDANNIYIIEPGTNGMHQIRIGQYDGVNYGVGFTRDGGITWQNSISFEGTTLKAADEQRISQLRIDVDGLTTRVSDAEGNISVLQQTAQSLTTRITNAEGDISTLTQTANSLTTRVTNAEGNISTLTQTANSLTTRVTNAEGNISTLTQTAEGIRTDLTTAEGNISSLQQTATSLTTRISTAEGNISTLTQTANSLTTRVGTAEGNISTLQQTATSLTTRISTAEGNISTLTQTANGLATRVGTAEGNISSLQQTATSLTSRVSSAEGNITTLQQTAAGLRADLTSETDNLQTQIDAVPGQISVAVSNVDAKTLTNGTSLIMTPEQVTIDGPKINFNVQGSQGDTKWDETGLTVPIVNSPSVADCYHGSQYITVHASHTPDGNVYFRSLTDALEALSNKWLPYGVSISLATDTVEDEAVLSGVYGTGRISINLNSHKVSGRTRWDQVGVYVSIMNGSIASSSGNLIYATHCVGIYIGGVSLIGANNTGQGVWTQWSKVGVEGCSVYNLQTAYVATWNASLAHISSVGNVYRMFSVMTNGRIGTTGTVATYSVASSNDGTGIITGSVPGSGSGGTTPSTPTATTTVTASTVSTRTYQAGGSGWFTNTDTMQAGLLAGYRHYAVIAFGTTGWGGQTIAAATLSLRRLTGGSGGSVNVYLKTTSVTPGSGNPTATTTDYGMIGTISANRTETFTIPAAALQEISNGTRRSLMIYDDSAQVSSRNYSTNYGMYAGSGDSSYKPSLTVTYNS